MDCERGLVKKSIQSPKQGPLGARPPNPFAKRQIIPQLTPPPESGSPGPLGWVPGCRPPMSSEHPCLGLKVPVRVAHTPQGYAIIALPFIGTPMSPLCGGTHRPVLCVRARRENGAATLRAPRRPRWGPPPSAAPTAPGPAPRPPNPRRTPRCTTTGPAPFLGFPRLRPIFGANWRIFLDPKIGHPKQKQPKKWVIGPPSPPGG